MYDTARVRAPESHRRSSSGGTLGDRAAAVIVFWALVYIGAQCIRAELWPMAAILAGGAIGVLWQLRVWRRAARAYPRPENECGVR